MVRWLRVPVVVAPMLALAACSRANPSFGHSGGDEGGETRGELSTGAEGDDGSVSISSSVSGTGTGMGPGSGEASSGAHEEGSDGVSPRECGNGITEGDEACDDGPDNAHEGFCQPDCTKNECGDGYVAPDQPCDDKNHEPDDGCDECVLTSCGNEIQETGEACDDGPNGSADCTPLCTAPYCGDHIVTTASEQCDDGNHEDADACVECVEASCGDGVVYDGVEGCDDENNTDGDGCSALCVEEFCGDGIVQGAEECDGMAIAPPMCLLQEGEVVLACDPIECVWINDGMLDCCTPQGEPCIMVAACCMGMMCGDGTCVPMG